MRRFSFLLLIHLLVLPPTLRAASSLSYLSVGPMLHWNFKDRGFTVFSYGIEASWWRFDQAPIERGSWFNLPDYKLPGFGIAVGFEIDRNAIRVYAEPEVGAILVGFNFRYRHIGGDHHQAIGLYTKVPFFVGGEVAYLEVE